MKATLRFAILSLSLLSLSLPTIGCGSGDGASSTNTKEAMEKDMKEMEKDVPLDPEKSADETKP